ncbi:MAG: DUF6125 family protein [Thermodesulfobacteriota bacterium]
MPGKAPDYPVEKVDDLSQEDLARYVLSMAQRMILHYALWFTEIRHQMGLERAMDAMESATEKDFQIQMKRLSKVLGFDMKNELPAALADLPREKLSELLDAVSTNWLVNDGVWFQSVEFAHGMNEAKRCNDSTWAQFSPVEAQMIKRYLRLSEKPGLEGLKKALGFRVYANINTQSIVEEGPGSFVFQMNECRVQAARKKKNLEDYPCKSAGLVEYAYFASAIDPRIETQCIGCPPDDHPDEWFCAWRFTLSEKQ